VRGLEPALFDEIAVPAMPEPERPDPKTWVPAVARWLGEEPSELAQTVLVAHSVGCQAVVRALATLGEGQSVQGCLLVAPWFWLDGDEQDETSALWEETTLDERAARRAAGRLVALLSDNDPFTSDWKANAQAWEKRLGAEVAIEPGREHFNERREPRILELLLSRFGSRTG
jgi:predicted alpha/beta hydrolase family esterase